MSDEKYCPECLRDSPTFEISDDEDLAAVLEHYLEEHPKSERLKDVVDGSWVAVSCDGCPQTFWSPTEVDKGRLLAEAYCPDCLEANYVRPLIVQQLTPEEYVQKHGDPIEKDLPRSATRQKEAGYHE